MCAEDFKIFCKSLWFYTAAVSSLPTCICSVPKVNIVLVLYFKEMEEAKKFLGRVLTQ